MALPEGDQVDLGAKVAVITGAGGGLGRSYALALAAAGCQVVVNDVGAEAVDEVVAAIEHHGGIAAGHVGAVGTADVADQLVNTALEHFNRIDVMVTNAGILRDRVLWKMSEVEFNDVISTHLNGTFTCAQSAVRQMRAQGDGGSLILVSSVAGQLGNFGQTNYAAAKAGVAAMARTWALELESFGIRVNALIPNALTRMVASIPGFAEMFERSEKGEPIPASVRQRMWMGTPDDVSPMVVFLASDRAAKVTGQCVGIGGDKIALWAHPYEAAVAYRPGGWSADAIADIWETSVGAHPSPYGITFLEHLRE